MTVAGNPDDGTPEGTAGGAAAAGQPSRNYEVTVLFFAAARQAAGVARSTVSAVAGSTVQHLRDELCSCYGPGLEAVMATCAIWVNGSPARPGTLLQPGDEVAVLPPVSGG